MHSSAPAKYCCGRHAHNHRASVWVNYELINMAVVGGLGSVHNSPQQAGACTQTTQFLYTVCAQQKDFFQAVIKSFVHIIHRAYIYENKSYKGVY